MNRPKYLIVHHSGGTAADPLADTSHHSVWTVNNHHKTLWPGFVSSLGFHVGYHHFIDKEGKHTQTRKDWEVGAHVRGYNTRSIGICLAGNFDLTKPTEKQIKTLTGLLKQLCKQHNIDPQNIVPHRKFANKSCYGRNLTDDWARKLVTDVEPDPIRSYTIMQLINELKRRIRDGEL